MDSDKLQSAYADVLAGRVDQKVIFEQWIASRGEQPASPRSSQHRDQWVRFHVALVGPMTQADIETWVAIRREMR
jgi:hypothetical protein